jgi:hypothetical protein
MYIAPVLPARGRSVIIATTYRQLGSSVYAVRSVRRL